MSKFEVGEKVAFYHKKRRVGRVKDIDSDANDPQVLVEYGNNGEDFLRWLWVHPKQCRRLVTKIKKVKLVKPQLLPFSTGGF